jgi:protein-S-isoprenylcysteine O-methyltransferase Ste14
LRWLTGSLLTLAVFFGLAGKWNLPWLWATAAVAALAALAMFLTIDPELARERRRPGPGGVDRRTQVLLSTAMSAQVIVACVDVGRFHWSDTVPPGLRAVGLVLFGGGFGLVTWSVAVNRFFSSVVRVQADRGHSIVTSGPYGYVRHPGYLGMLMSYPFVSLAIGSWWAMVPGAACVAIVLRRAMLEDVYLQQHLPGYQDYAASVPDRLVLGVW